MNNSIQCQALLASNTVARLPLLTISLLCLIIGPIHAIPLALKQAGLSLEQMDWIELNEAFAAQALAVIETLGLPRDKVNPLGGAIALGHPLGATGTIKAATLLHGLRRTGGKYGMVTMCIGTGMGAAAIFEAL